MSMQAFMSDKSDAILGAISTVYPHAEARICYFHVMQAVQRWLKRADNGIMRSMGFPPYRWWGWG